MTGVTSDTEPGADLEHDPRRMWTAADCECGPDFWRTAFAHRVQYGAPAMTYEAALLYHLHVVQHQGLGGRS